MDNEMTTEVTENIAENPGSEDIGERKTDPVKDGNAAEAEERGSEKKHLDEKAINGFIEEARKQGENEASRKFDERIREANVINPHTGKPFETFEEYHKYGEEAKLNRQRQEARDTKRKGQTEEQRLQEIQEAERLMELGRKAEKKEKEEREKARIREAKEKADAEEKKKIQGFLVADARKFNEAYPDVKIEDLENNAEFREFCDDRYADGKHSLVKLYEQYVKLVGNAGKAAEVRRESRDSRSTSGSRTGGGTVLTAAERKELEAWNERYPHLSMTEAEFKSSAN